MGSTLCFFLSILLTFALVIIIIPGGVHSLTATSSSSINRSFNCTNNVSLNRGQCEYKTKTLYIQGFVPASNDVFNSETIVPAAYLAIDDINANCSLLRNYTLQVDFVNTLCDPSEATWQLIDSIVIQNNTEPKVAFLGGGCSLATEPVAALSGRFYRIPHISYGASSPSLSKRDLFPRFVRTIPSEIQANTARLALMQRYGWTKVATLHETQTIFSLAVEDFHTRYDMIYNTTDNESEEELILRSFTDDPNIPLNQIKEKDVRIIFGYFYEDKAVTVLCDAIKLGLTGDNNLWMFPAWFTAGWWNTTETNCTIEQMRKAVRYSFFLDSYLFGNNTSDPTDTGTKTADDFNTKYDCYLEEFRQNPQSGPLTTSTSLPHIYRTFSYDAVWTTALALDKADRDLEEMRNIDPNFNLTLDDFKYFDENDVSRMISANMEEASFTGISGNVRFDSSGTRVGLSAVYQLVNKTEDGDDLELKLLTVHDPTLEGSNSTDGGNFNINFTYRCDPIFKTGMPPNDRRTPKNIYMMTYLVILCCVVTAISVVIAFALLIFNVVTVCKPLIRDSAPHINTVVIIGCIVMLGTCFLLSIDSGNPRVDGDEDGLTDEAAGKAITEARDKRYQIICILRLWSLTIGFTLSFGALFAKTWQVYRIYTNPKLQKEKFKMWNFLIIIGIFLFIDVAYLSFWTAVYRFERRKNTITDAANDVENIYEYCGCDNFPYLVGALYVYKGLLVVFGLFLAYESRNVKYYFINDSRFVSISMYIVVILVGIGAPLSLVLAVHYFVNPAYVLAIFMTIGSCLSCLLILYIPKFVFMARGKDTMVRENSREEITVSDGLQLGRTTIDQTEVHTMEEEVSQLKQNNAEKAIELQNLEGKVVAEEVVVESDEIKPRSGSDGDSGVLVTGDEHELFSTESTTTSDRHHQAIVTPSPENHDDDDDDDDDDVPENPEV